jgi:hypothetical protein
VARMVAERESGKTLTAIADGLTADGVATAQGGARWYPATVRKSPVRSRVRCEMTTTLRRFEQEGQPPLHSHSMTQVSEGEWAATHLTGS